MKHVFPTFDEVAHIFNTQRLEPARCRNGFIEDGIIYSYGRHFPVAKFHKNKRGEVVLVTDRTYSNTTRDHIGSVLNAVSNREIIRCGDVDIEDKYSRGKHKKQLSAFQTEINNLAIFTARARTSFDWKLDRLNSYVANANKYSEHFGLKKKFKSFDESEVAKLLEKNKAVMAKEREKENKLIKIGKQLAPKYLALWRADLKIPEELADEYRKYSEYIRKEIDSLGQLLRLSTTSPGTVQTSKHADFPLSHGVLALKSILASKEKSQEWVTNGHSIHLGNFVIDKIDPNGDVHAGCHFVTFNEIELFSKSIGLLNEDGTINRKFTVQKQEEVEA